MRRGEPFAMSDARSRRTALLLIGALITACGGGSAPPGSASPVATVRATTAPAASSPGATIAPSDATPMPSAATPAPSVAAPTPTTAPSAEAPFRWTALATEGAPPAREDHTWTVDPDGGAAYLFGGRDGSTVFDDLWRFDLAADTWERVSAAGPTGRFGHTATWVEGVGVVVWSGQGGPTTFFDDLWVFDPAAGAWSELPDAGPRPAARYGSCAALDGDGRLWISHGFTADAGRFADTWTYDVAAGSWTEVTPDGQGPVVRCLHDCLWTPDGRLVVYAGQTTGVPAIGDLWALGDGAWTKADGAEPPARQLYGLATVGDAAWVFGGAGADRAKLADLWRLDLGTLGWESVAVPGDGPAGRSGATLVADGTGGRLLLFGGLTADGASAETWSLPLRP